MSKGQFIYWATLAASALTVALDLLWWRPG